MPNYNIPTKSWTFTVLPVVNEDPSCAEDSDEENVSYDYDYPSSDEEEGSYLDDSDSSLDDSPRLTQVAVPVTDREASLKLLREKNARVIKSLSKP